MNRNSNSEAEKREILLFLYEKTRTESEFLRERQYKLFTWTSSILIGLIGVLLITDPNATFSSAIGSSQLKLIAILTIVGFVLFSVNWQQRHRLWIQENGLVINRIQELLHCHEIGYFDSESEEALLPQSWRFSATTNRRNFFQRLLYANYVSATMFLGIMTIIMLLVYGI